jgi:hypothetical protein
MINTKILLAILGMSLIMSTSVYRPVTAIVTIAAASVKASIVPLVQKHKRKDCPICKGKGWYISGDGIAKVDCGYCEETTEVEYR